jgi:hypothetical protein
MDSGGDITIIEEIKKEISLKNDKFSGNKIREKMENIFDVFFLGNCNGNTVELGKEIKWRLFCRIIHFLNGNSYF